MMSTKILVVMAFCFLAGCSKDKYTTKPQLKYKGVNTRTLSRSQTIKFTLDVTDAEGDLQDTIWVQEVVRNCGASGFKSPYQMPEFAAAKNFKGEVEVCFSYGTGLDCPTIKEPGSCPNRNDSATFKFWIQDKAKNVSDTVSSDEVVVLLQ